MDDKTKVNHRNLFLRPKKLKNVLEHVTEEMYKRNLELAQTNKTLSLLRMIDKLVLETEGSTKVLCGEIVNEISKTMGYPLVMIFAKGKLKENTFKAFGIESRIPMDPHVDEFIKNLELSDEQMPWLQSDETSIGLSLKDVAKRDHFMGSSDSGEVVGMMQSVGVKSLYVIKLSARGRLVGLMAVGMAFDETAESVTSDDQDLINRLSGTVGIALDNKLLLDENTRVVEQLKRTNGKLKNLDEIKDEFLSMASHQLRTPLTSIKGYVSMVLEGDAGKVSPQQGKLLMEAFKSSERMVGLITDFLNVSRLQTGNFVIDKSLFDLRDVVEQEVKDLRMIAESHNIKLHLKVNDKKYPVNADESKIRQVMMNFIDNAVYYSHPDTTIVINLEKVGDEAQFTVVDTGIGVPKDEQAKLFTRFFRAKNARKQRPDGTGVGLYLARRVVIGHSGSIVFSSTEGNGSTFGFRLPLEKDSVKK